MFYFTITFKPILWIEALMCIAVKVAFFNQSVVKKSLQGYGRHFSLWDFLRVLFIYLFIIAILSNEGYRNIKTVF